MGFPDTKEGIEAAVSMGADTFWLNTVLYDGHPVEDFQGFYAIGQSPADAFEYDDKFYTNTALKMRAFPLSHSELQMKITPTAMIFRALSSRYGAGAVKALLDVQAKLSFERLCSMRLLQKIRQAFDC